MQEFDGRGMSPILHEQKIDLRQYANVLKRRKWLIIGLTVLAMAVAAAAAFLLPPVYRATALLMIESQEANIIQVQKVYDAEVRGQDYYQTQFEILKSRPLAETVVQNLQLSRSPDFQPKPSYWPNFFERWLPVHSTNTAIHRDAETIATDLYLQHLQIQPKAKTQLVSISFEASDAALAANIANAHAQAFIENHMNAKEEMTRTAAQWMSGRLLDLQQKLSTAEKNLQAFKEREQLIDIDGMKTLPAHELTELTTKLVEARRSLSEGRNMYEQVSAVRSAALNEKLSIPAVASDELVRRFKQAEAEAESRVAELARRYGPQHPKMKAAISERDAAVAELSNQVDNVIGTTKNQYDVLRSQEHALAVAMNDTKTHVNVAGRKEAQYRELLREVEANRQLYELFYKRIGETTEVGDFANANARVIEPAIAPPAPVRPQRGLLIGMAGAVGVILGVMLAFLLEAMSNTVRHGNDVAEKIRVPLLALVPSLHLSRKKNQRIGHQFLERSEPKFVEAIRTLRTGVNLSGLDKSIKTIMVTSSISDEGKTSIACNLALAFAQIERVLLIDADMRRPSLSTEFQIARDQPGLTALFAGNISVADCIVRRTADNLDVLPVGELPPNPQDLLVSQKFRALIDKLSERYDRIIIDCPPVLPVSDALLLANIANAAIYVVRADSTLLSHVNRGLEQLRRTRVDVMGVVLNQVDTKKVASYGEYGGTYTIENYRVAGAS